ncbi:hypothetical protein KR222_011768, partial [Zaprionus bogoriensis]
MNFDEEDKLELQHLAGGNIVEHAPVFSAQGRFVFVRCRLKVQVFVTSTGELTRELHDATAPLISLELDVKEPELLLGCTSEGQLLRWHWRTGVLQKNIQLKLEPEGQLQLLTFNLLNLYKEGETACAFVTAKDNSSNQVSWFVFNTSTGTRIAVQSSLQLQDITPQVDVGRGAFKYIIIGQGKFVQFVSYENWQVWQHEQPHNHSVTCVRFSPCEEAAATGDDDGVIVIWRQFTDPANVLSMRHHWHNTPIKSIAFTPMGLSFYSSASDAVLVKWSMSDLNDRSFLPRMSSAIRHVVISDGNEHVLVCTEDNALQYVMPNDMRLTSALQHFTYALPDKTGRSQFPVGLHLNPRTNSIVLNGRIGYLQFYSAYTKSLLYNLRIVEGNVLSQEPKRIIYNTCVTRAAFNINWMATGEEYNDQRNFAELRLKFWQYHEKMQTYKLNTNIELPHEEGFQAITFSNQFQVNNLRCATAGKDNVIKLWTLGESENIYKHGSMWSCAAQASYKHQQLGAICFSQDGSLLAAGFGNTLVLYDARSLGQLHALSTAAGFDGVIAKAQLRVSQTPVNGTRSEVTQQRQQLWSLLQKLLDSNDPQMIEQARQLMSTIAPCQSKPSKRKVHSDANKESVFKHIMQMSELGLHQKLQLLRRFGIDCAVHEANCKRLTEYLRQTVVSSLAVKERLLQLETRLHRLRVHQRFKAKQRLVRLTQRRHNYEQLLQCDLLPLFSVLHLDETPRLSSKVATQEGTRWSTKPALVPADAVPLQSQAQISHVQYGAGAQAHLVAVCTESRVLIWNLLTLRLQAGLKLSVKQLAFDPLTNLIAVVTRNDELHVFQPNVPLPVYQRYDMPKLHGLVWLPRRQPKNSSINVDWQAQSTLHMLTHDREIVYLATPGEASTDDDPAPISFAQPAAGQEMQYATFGAFMANQRTSASTADLAQRSGPLIIGRNSHSAVNALVNLSAHTMPAVSLICGEFIKSLLTPTEALQQNKASLSNGKMNGSSNGILSSDDSDTDEEAENDEKKAKKDKQNDEEEEEEEEQEEEEEGEKQQTKVQRKEQAAATLEVRRKL